MIHMLARKGLMVIMRWSLNVPHGLRKPFITRRRVQGLDMFLAKIEIVYRIRIFDLSIIFWHSWLTEVCFCIWLVSSFENCYQGHMWIILTFAICPLILRKFSFCALRITPSFLWFQYYKWLMNLFDLTIGVTLLSNCSRHQNLAC